MYYQNTGQGSLMSLLLLQFIARLL